MLGAADLKVGGQVLIRVAPPVRAGDPDLLSAELRPRRALALPLTPSSVKTRAHPVARTMRVGKFTLYRALKAV